MTFRSLSIFSKSGDVSLYWIYSVLGQHQALGGDACDVAMGFVVSCSCDSDMIGQTKNANQ